MSYAMLYTRAQQGIESPLVIVEVHLSAGLPGLSIVGLPETAVKESKDRVRSAIINSNFEFPAQRITINLAPADLPKQGGRYDLAIALGILAASGQIPCKPLKEYEFIGELALTGKLRAIQGALPNAMQTRGASRKLILPNQNAQEACLVNNLEIYAATHMLAVCAHLADVTHLEPVTRHQSAHSDNNELDLSDLYGQFHAKRALEIAAAGAHSILMSGPPGTGKTMLASRLPGLLPEMSDKESLETASIASISQAGFNSDGWKKRPFRAPHHTASGVALVGGGSNPMPGEISLAHNGVLFLDELPEFDRRVLDVLREPLESGKINISRAARQVEYPARFQLIAAMNPCPCGYLGDPSGRCHCNEEQIRRYRLRISGPLMDRIDMHIEVPRLNNEGFLSPRKKQAKQVTSHIVRQRVQKAHQQQIKRYGKSNSAMTVRDILTNCPLSKENITLIETACEQLGLSARAQHRIIKLSRTIADLDESKLIEHHHIKEALSYRRQEHFFTNKKFKLTEQNLND